MTVAKQRDGSRRSEDKWLEVRKRHLFKLQIISEWHNPVIIFRKFFIHLGFTWKCVTGLTVLLWEDHYLTLSPLDAPPVFSVTVKTGGICSTDLVPTLRSFISHTCWIPEALLRSRPIRSTFSIWGANTWPNRYVMNSLYIWSWFIWILSER